jgi:hypothetical protein
MYACENECLFDSIHEENHGQELPPMAAPTEVPDSEVPQRFASTVAIESVATTREPEMSEAIAEAADSLWEMLKVIFITTLAMFINQQVHN